MDEEKAKAFDRTVSAVLSAMDECKTINHNDIALTESGLQSVNKLLDDGILKNIKTRYRTFKGVITRLFYYLIHSKSAGSIIVSGAFNHATYHSPNSFNCSSVSLSYHNFPRLIMGKHFCSRLYRISSLFPSSL